MTMRRELRETLQWCLKQHFPFRAADMCEAFDQQPSLANRKLRLLASMGLIEREQLIGTGMPFQYRVINRELAEKLSTQEPRIRYEKAPEPKRITPRGCSFIFHMGA
jgi:predicted transcriptional regulator